MNAKYWIDKLSLTPHPEGGYFKQTYRSDFEVTNKNQQTRKAVTSIYFLLEKDNYSAFHRIQSDEVWNYHYGDPIDVYEFTTDHQFNHYRLGSNIENNEVFQCTIKAGSIFASCCYQGYGIVGCTVAPGFDFQDFELFTKDDLKEIMKDHEEIVNQLAYKPKSQ